jgi:hypothetical protein
MTYPTGLIIIYKISEELKEYFKDGIRLERGLVRSRTESVVETPTALIRKIAKDPSEVKSRGRR